VERKVRNDKATHILYGTLNFTRYVSKVTDMDHALNWNIIFRTRINEILHRFLKVLTIDRFTTNERETILHLALASRQEVVYSADSMATSLALQDPHVLWTERAQG